MSLVSMDAPNTRAQRLEENRGLREKAPLAAQFEDCLQASQQLTEALYESIFDDRQYRASHDCKTRLKIWGDETGASSRALDYAVRCSPVVRQQTLQLLKDLHAALEQVMAGAWLQDPVDREDDDALEASVGASAPVPQATNNPEATADYPEGEYDPEMDLQEASDIIDYLADLLPALRDPPHDSVPAVAPDTGLHSEESYSRLAAMMFPNASEEVLRRLGRSNLRRQQTMCSPRDPSSRPPGSKLPRRRIQDGQIYWQRRLQRTGISHVEASEQNSSSLAESEVGASTTTVTPGDTGSSERPRAGQESVTSGTDVSQPYPVQRRFEVPKLPSELADADQLDCPFCRCELPLVLSSEGMSTAEWKDHVFQDLRPYVCTFDGCFSDQQLFAKKSDWITHEVDFHRSRTVWHCGVCRWDFQTLEDFEAHLQSQHFELSQDHCLLIRAESQRYSSIASVRDRNCGLCGLACGSIEELGHHLAAHLEDFALSALEAEPREAGLRDDGKIQIHEFLEELPDVPDRSSDMGFAENEPRSSLASNGGFATMVDSRTGGTPDSNDDNTETESKDHWSEKVGSYLDRQIGRDSAEAVQHNVQPRSENFVGRVTDLEIIHKHFSSPGRICTVSGRGGIGKTAVAAEYVHKHESEYSYAFWVDADNPGTCAEKYGEIASRLELAEEPPSDESARIFFVKGSLSKSERRWLLIFDNVGAWSDISRYIPRNLPRTKGCVLITTRSASSLGIPPRHPAVQHHRTVKLEVWPLEHGREFLLTSVRPNLNKLNLQSDDEYDEAAEVVGKVERLPLALSMVVGYVKVSRCTLRDFLDMWEEKEYVDKMRKRKIDVTQGGIDATIDALWSIGISDVRMNSRRLLDVLSFLDPEVIQKSLLVGDHKEEYLEFLNSSAVLRYTRMFNELQGRRLLTPRETTSGEPAYRIHRLLQQKVLLDMEEYAFADAFRKAFRLIRAKFPAADPRQVPVQSTWDAGQEFFPHVFTFHRVYKDNAAQIPLKGLKGLNSEGFAAQITLRDVKPEELVGLFYDAGFYVYARQTTAHDGLPFLNTAMSILDSMLMDQHAKTRADVLCVSGLLLLNMGCLERPQGTDRLKEALRIRKRIHKESPDRDSDVLLQNAANDYSLCLLNEHRFDEARTLFEGCRKRYVEWGPEEENPFEHAKHYGNYSVIHLWRDDMAGAIESQERALGLTEQFSGRYGQYWRRAFMLGCILLQAGDLQGALEKQIEVLAARLELHGRLHTSTILSTYAVGAMYHHTGDLATASDYIHQCIETAKSSNWDVVAFARAQYHLSLLYREQEIEQDTAAALETDALRVFSEYNQTAADCVRGVDDTMMIFDDLLPTFSGRYTGRALLPHLRRHLARRAQGKSGAEAV